MIKKMRELAPILMVVILITFVGGTILLDWGMNVMGQGAKAEVGRINGKKIPIDQFDNLVNMERFRRQGMGAEMTPRDYRAIPTDVWNREVHRVLVDEATRRMRLESSTDVVFEYLRRNPLPGLDTNAAFMRDGVFDTTLYAQWLSTPQTYTQNPALVEVERQISEQVLPGMKTEALLRAGVFVSPAELAFDNSQRTDRATFEFYKVHTRDFRSNIEDERVTEKMINDFYNANRDRFHSEERVDLYVARIPKVPTERDIEINREMLIDIRQRVLDGENTFEELATFESDDETTSQNGGDLGWIDRGRMPLDFDITAFALNPGEISEPVKTILGYHLIKVEERGEADSEGNIHSIRARHILIRDNVSNETLDALSERADALRQSIMEKGFLNGAAEFSGVQIDSTGFFERGRPTPGMLGELSGVGTFAFGPRRGDVSEPIEGPHAFYVLGIRERIKRGISPLEFVRGPIIEALKDTLARQDARAHAERVLEKVKSGTPLNEIREADELVAADTAVNQSAGGYIPQLGFLTKTVAMAFAIPVGTTSGIIEDRDGFGIVRVLERAEPEPFDWNSPGIHYAKSLVLEQGRSRIYETWFQSLRNNADIRSRVDRFYLD